MNCYSNVCGFSYWQDKILFWLVPIMVSYVLVFIIGGIIVSFIREEKLEILGNKLFIWGSILLSLLFLFELISSVSILINIDVKWRAKIFYLFLTTSCLLLFIRGVLSSYKNEKSIERFRILLLVVGGFVLSAEILSRISA